MERIRPGLTYPSRVSTLGNFVWSIAVRLRGVNKPHQYGSVILQLTVIRRLDAGMAVVP